MKSTRFHLFRPPGLSFPSRDWSLNLDHLYLGSSFGSPLTQLSPWDLPSLQARGSTHCSWGTFGDSLNGSPALNFFLPAGCHLQDSSWGQHLGSSKWAYQWHGYLFYFCLHLLNQFIISHKQYVENILIWLEPKLQVKIIFAERSQR